jgi:hypothetical protein
VRTFPDDAVDAELIRLAREEKDPTVREDAVSALGSIRTDAAKSVLLETIEHPPEFNPEDSQSRYYTETITNNAARALAVRGITAIDDVLPLMSSTNVYTRKSIITLLRCTGERGIGRILELVTHDDPNVAGLAQLGLREMGSLSPHYKIRVALIRALLAENPKIVEASARALWRENVHNEKEAVPKLLEWMVSDIQTYQVKVCAACVVLRIDPTRRSAPEIVETIPVAIRLLKKGAFADQAPAAELLGLIGPDAREALPWLKQRLALPDDTVERNGLPKDHVSTAARQAIAAIENR